MAFYDIDTPVTLAKLDRGDTEYISRALVMRYDMYLSFTGGPTLKRLEKRYYAKRPRELYCSVDASAYHPGAAAKSNGTWAISAHTATIGSLPSSVSCCSPH